jgi:hypothetical protein
MLKLVFPFAANSSDGTEVELLFANYYLEYSLGRIDADQAQILKLISLANLIKYKSSLNIKYPFKYYQLFKNSQVRN